MENDENSPRKIIYIRLDKDSDPIIDPEVIKWLTEFAERMNEDIFTFENLDIPEPSELDELEYMDSTVQGDEQPEALSMIMDAYYKHKENR